MCGLIDEERVVSYDLAFWHEIEPSDPEKAAEIYDRLSEGEKGVLDSSVAIEQFFDDVISAYPDLTEENMSESPWASTLYRNSECVIASISWSRQGEVGGALRDMARGHGLTVYDPQEGTVQPAS